MASFSDIVSDIQAKDPRYDKQAYYFVRKCLDYTIQRTDQQERKGQGEVRHVTGQELLNGMREYALDQYGPLTYTVLEYWGLKRCEDVGEIVFNLVDRGVLGKTDTDEKADFSDGYHFEDAFVKPFEP